MKVTTGNQETGDAGQAIELMHTLEDSDSPNQQGLLAIWYLTCPNQSPAWDAYLLTVVHLREIPGQTEPPQFSFEGATHELMMFALNPEDHPAPDDPSTWKPLVPFNVAEQFTVPTDEAAKKLLRDAALQVIGGRLFAEPPFSGQMEPWHSWVRNAAFYHGGPVDQCLPLDANKD